CGGTGVAVVAIDLPVPDFAHARITVVDADTQQPIEGASVSPTNEETNAAGVVEYTRPLGFDGQFTQFPVAFAAVANGYHGSTPQTVTMRKDETVAVRIELTRR